MLQTLVGFYNLDDPVLEPVFLRCVDAIRRSLQGFSKSQPLTLASDLTDKITLVPYISNDEELIALSTVTLDDVREFCRGLFSNIRQKEHVHSTALLYGNVSNEDVDLVRGVISTALSLDLDYKSASQNTVLLDTSASPSSVKSILLPAGTSVKTWTAHTNREEVNSGLKVTWQLGIRTPRNVALGQLVAMLMSTEAFYQLRTQEQLGYIVQLGLSIQADSVVTLNLNVSFATSLIGSYGHQLFFFLLSICFADPVCKLKRFPSS